MKKSRMKKYDVFLQSDKKVYSIFIRYKIIFAFLLRIKEKYLLYLGREFEKYNMYNIFLIDGFCIHFVCSRQRTIHEINARLVII